MSLELFARIAETQTILFGLGFLLTLVLLKKGNAITLIKSICIFFLLGLCGDIAGEILFRFKIYNYNYSAYLILVLPLISWIYYCQLNRPDIKIFVFINSVYILFAGINVLFIQKGSINSYSAIFLSTIVLAYALYYFYWLIQKLPAMHLQRLPMFWINSAFILYYSGNFLLFVFTAYLVNVLNNNLIMYWTLHNLLGITECIMLIIAVLVEYRNTRTIMTQ